MINRKVSISICLIIIATINIIAYAGNVVGKVIDSNNKEPMEFVNVTIRKVGSEKALPLGVVTNVKGDFKLTDIPRGKYIVKLSYVGYVSALKNVTVAEGDATLSAVALVEDGKVLDEVQVVGMKSQMRFDLDKKVFNVDQNIAAAGASASEILETIPSVEVDNEGEVSLRGNSSVTVWINGKPSGLSSDNRAQILEQLPAESIEKIEIITNPSARFNPEGTAGIINIVLKQNRAGGYYGSAQVGGNTNGGANVSGNINYNNMRWDTYASIGYRHRSRETNNDSYRVYNDDTFLNSAKRGNRKNDMLFVRAGATYYITKVDQIYLNGFGMFGKGKTESKINYESNAVNEFLTSLNDNYTDTKNKGGNVELGYQHKFGESHTLDASIAFNTWIMPQDAMYRTVSDYPESVHTESLQRQESQVDASNWEFQLDYVNQFTKQFKIEAGYKGSLGSDNSPISTYMGANDATLEIVPELYNRFLYDKNIQALYASFGGRINKFNFQAGLRGEYWHVETKSLGYRQSEKDVEAYSTNKFALFPSAFLSYSLPQDNELQLNYTRRLQRPWGRQLNPFVNISDPTNLSYGNPYLDPQYSHSMELNYIKTWDQHMLSLSGYYKNTDNVIQRISFINDGVMNTTYDNMAKSTSAGTELVLKDKFFKILELTTTVNLFYYSIDGFTYYPKDITTPVIGKAQDNFSWNIRAMASVQLPWGINLQVNGGYSAKQIFAQGYRDPQYRLDAGVKKSFKHWIVSVNVRDILNSRNWHSYTTGDTFVQESKSWGTGCSARLTVTYNFGNMKAKKGKKPSDKHEESQGNSEESSPEMSE